MWFYNVSTGYCSQFLWGECSENSNKFLTYELCQATCEPLKENS